ncbi:hypothetical protein IJO12_08625, partial [bacterium]|nr:hypothetical protein [bacterium]
RARWERIADEFSKATKNSNYEFDVSYNGKVLDIESSVYDPKRKDVYEHGIEFFDYGTERLMKLKDSSIVKKLVKLQNIYKHIDKVYVDMVECMEKLGKSDKYGTLDEHYDNIFWAMLKKKSADLKAALENDNILGLSKSRYD